ncbi:MAG: hypothetical protein E7380_00270 [Clostridiales bacterium]|nr:hypothetical protein [Clostridiales bacterium]
MKIVRKILWIVLLLIFTVVCLALCYYAVVTKDVSLDANKLLLNEKTVTLYDGSGTRIKNLSSNALKQTVKINSLPKHVKQAFLDIEDKRFYSHHGFDYKRICGAALQNVKSLSFKEGASTISQQLIKNTHLTQEKTLKRKLKEWKLTKQLERKYSKEEILEKYLNTIYFGHGCFGLTAAAEFYFDKLPTELSVAESAILAGLVKAPNYYSPFKHPDKCEKRKAVVLNAMKNNGSISEEVKKQALNAPLPTPNSAQRKSSYLQAVFDELSFLSENKRFTVRGSIEIGTYLDQELQENIENLATSHTDSDKIFLVTEVEKHGIKAYYSSAGTFRRLPGSLIKPLLVYAPAIEENLLSPATPILDEKVRYGSYAPENYDNRYHGYVSARECMEKSYNIPAVKILDSLGTKKACSYMKKLGLPVEKDDESLALALGGMKNGYTLRDLACAYTTFANGGVYEYCGFIDYVKINGETVYKKASNPARVFSQDTAYLTTDMLRSTAKNGTAKKLRSLPFSIAAKTGTVGTQKGNTDAYALSYTSKDCVAVWLGNADNRYIEYTGGGLPCNYLLKINEKLYQNYQEKSLTIPDFSKPQGISVVELDKTAYYDTHTIIRADELSPASYRFSELFKTSAIPLNKSDSFSNPHIVEPTLEVKNGQVFIRLHERSPRYYQYKILRTDYATHTTLTLYEGEYFTTYIDKSPPLKSTCVYTVIPSYNRRKGTAVKLPAVSFLSGENPPAQKDKILENDWWKN